MLAYPSFIEWNGYETRQTPLLYVFVLFLSLMFAAFHNQSPLITMAYLAKHVFLRV